MTLVYLPKIKEVEIINKIEGTEITFLSELKDQENQVSKFTVEIYRDTIFELDHNFITFSTSDVSLAVEVADFENVELIPQDPKNPKLFRDFPLIGSQKFHFPFILNGFKFNPTEDRDGVLLHSKDGVDAIQNREIIDNAYNAATKFTSWLINQGAKNRLITAISRLPDEKWSETSKPWIEQNIQGYRDFIYQSKVVETATEGVISTLGESIIPNFGVSHASKLQFYQLVKSFKGTDKVPAENIILDWIEFVGPIAEENLWPEKIYYGLDDLMEEFSELGSIRAVSNKLGIKRRQTIEWVNGLIKFLVEQKESELLNEYAVIPNHNGDFLILKDLYLEDQKDPIDDEFLDIIEPLDEDWRDIIIHSLITIEGINVYKIGLSDLSERANEVLKEKIPLLNNKFKWKFKSREDAIERLVQILRIFGKYSKEDSFKNQIFHFGKEVFGFKDELVQVDHIETFRYENALKLFIELINAKIEEIENLSKLSQHLGISQIDANNWINDYLKLLKGKADFDQLLKYGGIVPNRYGYFWAFEDLKNFGTLENPLEDILLDILLELDGYEDWRKELVHECISIPMSESIKFEELGNRIQEIAFQLQKDDLSEPSMGHLDKYRNSLLDLIDWANHDERAEKYLKSFKEKSNELFYKLTMRDSNFTVDDIKMLSDPESKALLHKIHNSTLSKRDIAILISKAEMLGSVSALLGYADDLVREKQSMEWLLKVGTEVEKAFLDALRNESLQGKLSHIGSGSFDFRILNPSNGKAFYIELKSHANGSNRAFRFAPSQAKKAINSPGDFAICLIERPKHDTISGEYIKANTKSIFNSSNLFKTGYEDYKTYKKIVERDEAFDSKLRLVLLEKERIEVPMETLLKKSMDFDLIIEIIKKKIS